MLAAVNLLQITNFEESSSVTEKKTQYVCRGCLFNKLVVLQYFFTLLQNTSSLTKSSSMVHNRQQISLFVAYDWPVEIKLRTKLQ